MPYNQGFKDGAFKAKEEKTLVLRNRNKNQNVIEKGQSKAAAIYNNH